MSSIFQKKIQTVLLDIYVCKLKPSKRGAKGSQRSRRTFHMKGYFVDGGYMGYVDGVYMLFAGEEDYFEYLEEK